MSQPTLTPADEEALITTAEECIGGHLRSITYFTDDTVDQLYLRDYLEANANLESFAEAERPGFHIDIDQQNTELGAFDFTIRVFERGYVVSVLADGHGVFVTCDSMDMPEFKELGEALETTLHEIVGE
jgi:hypothetical protein